MLAMPGMRAFSLSARGPGGVSFDADGVHVGDVPLLMRSEARGAHKRWVVRPISKLNDELSALYRLPVDAAMKANALQLIATAFNRGDLAMAAIATVQMQFPDPPRLAKRVETHKEIERRAVELHRSGLLKFWDPAKHPHAGAPPNSGWFAPVSGEGPGAAIVVPVSDPSMERPGERPIIWGGGGGGGGGISPRQLEFPFPRFWSRPSTEIPAKPPSPPPRPTSPPKTQPELPFPEGLPRQRPLTGSDVEGAPSRGGRLGNPPVRAQNAEIAAKLKDQGFTITGGGGETKEEYIPPEGPEDRGTYVDITAVNTRTGETVRVQTIDTLADGTPDQREAAAEARIRKRFPNDTLILIPKRKTP